MSEIIKVKNLSSRHIDMMLSMPTNGSPNAFLSARYAASYAHCFVHLETKRDMR